MKEEKKNYDQTPKDLELLIKRTKIYSAFQKCITIYNSVSITRSEDCKKKSNSTQYHNFQT